MRNDTKITPAHLARNAYIYIRQSTEHQVRENLESQQRQYELVDLAQQYNWSEDCIIVIDDDLGRSALTHAIDASVHLLGEQLATEIIVSPRIASFGRLAPVVMLEDTGHAFHVGHDVHFHP